MKLPPMPPMRSKSGKKYRLKPMRSPAWDTSNKNKVTGTCKECEAEVPAVGLALAGKWWYCSECRPELFGRIGGRPVQGIVGGIATAPPSDDTDE